MTEAGTMVSFTFDGRPYRGRKGTPVGIALYAEGVKALGANEVDGAPRGLYCLIGQCFECRVLVNGSVVERACLLPLEAGMSLQPVRADAPLPTHPGQAPND